MDLRRESAFDLYGKLIDCKRRQLDVICPLAPGYGLVQVLDMTESDDDDEEGFATPRFVLNEHLRMPQYSTSAQTSHPSCSYCKSSAFRTVSSRSRLDAQRMLFKPCAWIWDSGDRSPKVAKRVHNRSRSRLQPRKVETGTAIILLQEGRAAASP
jgi:hypothetical protein